MSTILVVDDNVDICELVRLSLGASGHEVVAEYDGEAGLATAQKIVPDLVIVDWRMPKLNGIELCAALRADPKLARVPAILLTAMAQAADVDLGFAAGVDDYIIKPFSPRQLRARVDALLQRSSD